MMASLPVTASAQTIVARLGAGVAGAGSTGVAGLFALELGNKVFARADVRGLYTGPEVQAVFGGGGIGIRFMPRRRVRHYALVTLARGLDVREADYTTAAGVAFGGDMTGALGLFGEIRVEHQWQDESPYFRLPPNQITLIVGLRLGGS